MTIATIDCAGKEKLPQGGTDPISSTAVILS